jgi:O-antigen/teichoic acid export membrane protein
MSDAGSSVTPPPVPPPTVAGGTGRRGVPRMAFYTAVSNLALPLTSLLSGPILARTLGPVQRGEMAAAISPVFVLMFIANMGLPEAATYGIARLKQDPLAVFKRVGRLSLVYGVVTATALWFVAPYLLHRSPDVVPILRKVLLLLPLLMLVIILRYTVNGMREFRAVNTERVLTPSLRLGAFISLAVMGTLTVTTAALSQVIATVVGGCFLFLAMRRRRRHRASAEPIPHLTRHMASYGLRGWAAVLGNLVNWRLDQLVMVTLVSSGQLGYYVVAVHFSEIPATAVNAVRNLLFAESAHRDSLAIITRATRIVGVLVAGLALVGGVLAPWIVHLLFGVHFLPSVPMARVLLLASIPFCLEQVLAAGLLAQGRPGRRSVGQIVAAVVTLVGLLVLCPIMGAMGAAITSLVAYTVNCSIALLQFRGVSHLPWRRILVADADDLRWFAARLRSLVKKKKSKTHPPKVLDERSSR